MTAAELTARLGHVEDRQQDNWGWNWNVVKRVLEHLFEAGLISAASRTDSFERRYTLTARVLPGRPDVDPDAAATPDAGPDQEAALVRLIDAAARAHGIGTLRCFADYFRTPLRASAVAVEHLVEAGRLLPVTVSGWDKPVYRHVEAKLPRTATGRALLSPFDSLVFERRRLEALFGFHYRIEIYTPEPKRRFGYYVLPFLLRDGIVARVDLKADRTNGLLLARAAHAEPGRSRRHRRRTRRGTAAHGRVVGTGPGCCLPQRGPGAGARGRRVRGRKRCIRSEGTGVTGPASLP